MRKSALFIIVAAVAADNADDVGKMPHAHPLERESALGVNLEFFVVASAR